MAVEEMFIASAITMLGVLLTFVYLHFRAASSWLWERIWLIGIFMTMYVMMGIMRKGFQNVIVMTDLADLTFGIMHILMWCVILIIGYLILGILYHGVRNLLDIASGKAPKDDNSEVNRHGRF